MNKQEILNILDIQSFYSSETPSIKWNGSGMGQALCPFHDDHKPSLSVKLNTGEFKCFGCDKNGSIFDFYMAKHGVDFKTALNNLAKEGGIPPEPQKKIVKTYDYVDESESLLFQAIRYEPKSFNQRKPDGKGGWIYNLNSVRLVPYNLPELSKAESVIITEGEKDADNLKALGLTATCNPMGAGKWRAEFSQYFKDKRIVILPDNDPQGKNHAQTVAKNIKGISESVKVVELSGLPEKGDISNWLEKGGTKERLLEIIENTPEWTPEERRYLIRVEDILTGDSESIKWLIDDLLPEGGIALLTAPPSHFKTFLSLDMARCISQGIPFLGRRTERKTVYYIEKENPKSVIRLYIEKLGITSDVPLKVWPSWVDKEPPAFPDEIYLELAKERPLIVFDSLIRFYPKGTDENSSTDMAGVMGFLRRLTKAGATVLILHHKGKGEGSDYRGSSDIHGGVDIAYSVKKVENSYILTLKCFKSRFNIERDIPIEVISDDYSIRFEDASQKITQEREEKETEKMEAIKSLIGELENPNQTTLIEEAKKRLNLSKHEVRSLLLKGEGRYWISDAGKRGALTYKTLNSTFPAFQDIYSGEKLESSKDSQEEAEIIIEGVRA